MEKRTEFGLKVGCILFYKNIKLYGDTCKNHYGKRADFGLKVGCISTWLVFYEKYQILWRYM